MALTKNPLVGKRVVAVYLADDRKAIKFDVEGGKPVIAWADGDCCSSTWIEDLDLPASLIGGVVRAVEDIDMPDLGSPDEYTEIAYYGLRITTDKGVCVLDYRNASNGYYGGSIEWIKDCHYGGVYGQNESSEHWVKIEP